jgi:HK97 family phage prohead protease
MKEQKVSHVRLQIKSEDQGIITGRASVYGNVDAQGDIVLSGAFSKSLAASSGEILVLAQHNPDDVIGKAKLFDKPDGLHFEARLELGLQSARDMLTRIKSGLISGVSIGYVTKNATCDRQGNRLLSEVDLFEISLVTFPANDFARVSSVNAQQAEAAGIAVVSALSSINSQLKRGRVFSASNEGTLRDVHAGIEALREKVIAPLSQLGESA